MSGHTITAGADRLDVLLAFAGLPAEHADAWVDRYLLGMSLDEIAAAEGITRGGAHHRVKAANAALRRYLERREARRARVLA